MTINESMLTSFRFDKLITPYNEDCHGGVDPLFYGMADRITSPCIAKKLPVNLAIDWMVRQTYGGMKPGKIEYLKRVHANIANNSIPKTQRDKIYLAWNVMVIHFGWPGARFPDNPYSDPFLPGSAFSGKGSR